MDSEQNPAPKTVRKWTRTPSVLPIPAISPPHIRDPVYRPGYVNETPTPHSAPPTTTSFPSISAGTTFSHQQPRLRKERLAPADKLADKFDLMEQLLSDDFPFESLGQFFDILFYNRPHGEPDQRGTTHARMVGRFLHGADPIRMSHILPLIYHHRSSYPSINSSHADEQDLMFATTGVPDDLRNARPYISTWATRLVADEVRRQVGCLTKTDPEDPTHHVQLRAAANGRGKGHVVTWKDLEHWSLTKVEARFNRRGRGDLPMFLTRAASAPSLVGGVAVVRKQRPHPLIQIHAMASFVISRNRYANGDLAMILGIWLFACKSHIDVKRIYCRFGSTIADNTAREALNSMTISSLAELRAQVLAGITNGEMTHCLILDNVQEYASVYEQGIGRTSRLKVGTAGTSIEIQDAPAGAFNATDYRERLAKRERANLTTDSLFDDLDLNHVRSVIALHWARVLIEYHPHFKLLRPQLSDRFRTAPIAKHRMREGRMGRYQPLGTNGEKSTELQGMSQALVDLTGQMGIDLEKPSDLLLWVRGDGASYANFLRLTKYGAPLGIFQDIISTPEIWHAGATELNSTAENHYGPAASSDPSSLSKCSNAAGLKRPSNIKSCDYYPTVRNLTLIWEAHVLDCWRVYWEEPDLFEYIQRLAAADNLPSLDIIIRHAKRVSERYTTQAAILRSLSASASTDPAVDNKVLLGTPWLSPQPSTASTMHATKVHEEKEGFDGDRVLRNSEIFMTDFGWWIEFAYAVPEGDTGRVWEIMKLWIFKFAGSSHSNYTAYFLEVYCLLRYEASKELKEAIFNNWLVPVREELGHYIPGDLLQEHYNRWLEDMVPRHGGEFDNKFYRQTISPNVDHFLRIKEEIESRFGLKHRTKTHTSSHLRDELNLLLKLFKEEEVHQYRSGRSMGHAAVNQFARGCKRLDDAKLGEWMLKATCLGDFTAELRKTHAAPSEDAILIESEMRAPSPADSSSSSSSSASNESSSSSDSSSSVKSFVSDLGSIDANEPAEDGEDRSDAQLVSGLSREADSDEDEEETELELEEEVEDPRVNPYIDEQVN